MDATFIGSDVLVRNDWNEPQLTQQPAELIEATVRKCFLYIPGNDG
jgi:hypothetical protein